MSIQMQADDFFNAYLVLEENNKAFFEKQANSSETTPIGTNKRDTYPTMGPAIVCLAFSVELYLKDLHYVVRGKALRSHNILELFEELPEQIQQEIFAHDSISQNPFITRGDGFSLKRFTSDYSAFDGFIDHIKAISKGFEKWRYSYESTSLQYNNFFAEAFIEAMKSVANRARTNTRQEPKQVPEKD